MTNEEAEALVREFEQAVLQYRHSGTRLAREALMKALTEAGPGDFKFKVGQRVRKTGGYPFPGVVEARFLATQMDGTTVERYVVNQTVVLHVGIGPSGLLHIFAPAQLKAVEREEYIGPTADGVL